MCNRNVDDKKTSFSLETDGPPGDLAIALRRLRGNRELCREMITIFLEDYLPLLKRLQSAAVIGDSKALTRHAYRLQVLAANFEGHRMAAATKPLQRQLVAHGGPPSEENIALLVEAAEELAKYLRLMIEVEEMN